MERGSESSFSITARNGGRGREGDASSPFRPIGTRVEQDFNRFEFRGISSWERRENWKIVY